MSDTFLFQTLLFAIGIFLGTHLLIPLNIRISHRFGFVAHPNERRIHLHSKPEAGGLSFAILIVIAQAIVGIIHYPSFTGISLLRLAMVGLLAIALGLFDDKYESRARYKFLWQIALGVIMYFINYRVIYLTNPLGEHFILGWLSFPATILWYVIMINSINLIDGIDGLASGIAAIVSLVLLVVGWLGKNELVIIQASFLLAGNLAFLRHNFYPAKIFMGDTGTLFIGLNIAAISTAGSSQFKGITTMTLMIPLAVMAIPLIDVLLAIFRRLSGGNIFKADKQHIHHTMLGFGLSQKAISIMMYIATLLFGLIAIGFSLSSKKVLFSVLLGLMALMVIIAYIIMRQEQKK